jgi:UDP-N-acetylmuramoyl-tripeptide--D-alanyl-D-alanine ligase
MSKNTLFSADDIINATRGKLHGYSDWNIQSVQMDSREVKKGDLFIAIRPEKETEKYRTSGQDGHNFVQAAYESGAVAGIVDHPINCPFPQIIVPDTLQAMRDLGAFAKERANLKHSIGITGSVGKTSTRDMVTTAFKGSNAVTHSSIKSYNNMLGVPYTLSNMPQETEIGIFEVGMNFAGEITPLSQQVKPTIAIITWISESHIENFNNGLEGISDAKSELFNGMEKGGIAILPRDNDFYNQLADNAQKQNLDIYSFGNHDKADAQLLDIHPHEHGMRVKARFLDDIIDYNLFIIGNHHAMNSLPALLSVKLAGYNLLKAADNLSTIKPIAGRGERSVIHLSNSGKFTLIDEAYNASPTSTKAALKILKSIHPEKEGRRIVILGDMLELGENARHYHEDLREPIMDADIDIVHCCGEMMKHLYKSLPSSKQGAYAINSKELLPHVINDIKDNDILMVKGSHGSKMALIVEALIELNSPT